jgi:hypothetical protein
MISTTVDYIKFDSFIKIKTTHIKNDEIQFPLVSIQLNFNYATQFHNSILNGFEFKNKTKKVNMKKKYNLISHHIYNRELLYLFSLNKFFNCNLLINNEDIIGETEFECENCTNLSYFKTRLGINFRN